MNNNKDLSRIVLPFVTILVVSVTVALGGPANNRRGKFEMVSSIAFSSTRDNPAIVPQFHGAEIYLMHADGSNLVRLTENTEGDGFASLSPDGKKIAFDSTRNRAVGEPLNTSDLFLMNTDGSEQTHLIRGSSATWSPDSKFIAFHASASGTGLPIKTDPGAATNDSDIFVMNVDDGLAGVAGPTNITNNPLAVDDDPDWSPDGQKIAFTSHSIFDDQLNSITAEIYVINPHGFGLTRLTFNTEEERGPSWSPDGTRIVFMCRRGGPDFEICIMNADGTEQMQLTNNSVFDGTPTFSPDGQQIVFSRNIGAGLGQEVFLMNTDGTGQVQLTDTVGVNLLPNWGELRVHLQH